MKILCIFLFKIVFKKIEIFFHFKPI